MSRGVALPWGLFREPLWPMISSTSVLLAEPVFLAEPVEGWRAWGVDTSGTLRSITYPHVWGDGSNEARCASVNMAQRILGRRFDAIYALKQKRDRGDEVDLRLPDPVMPPAGHASPHVDCGCGFWVFKEESVLENNQRNLNSWYLNKHTGWLVTGRARAWGDAVEHEHGWRARHAEAFGDVVIHGLAYTGNRESLLPFLAEKIREKNRVSVLWRDSRGVDVPDRCVTSYAVSREGS